MTPRPAVAAALNAPAGTYNVADADPPTRGEIEAALAEVVGRGGLRSPIEQIPPALEPVARSQRVSSRRLRRRRAGIHACAGARRAGA